MKKEECLSRAEQELEARARELSQAGAELQEARAEAEALSRDLQDLQQQLLQLQAHRYGAEHSQEQWSCFPCILIHAHFVSLEEFIYVVS